jgi:hypothetical protein
MVRIERFSLVLLAFAVASIVLLYHLDSTSGMDSFTGLCVYSSPSFSVLTNGTHSVGVGIELETGKVYTVRGRFYSDESRMDVAEFEKAQPNFPLIVLRGYYWPSRGIYLLGSSKVRLAFPIQARKGEEVVARGIFYGRKFYPVSYSTGEMPSQPVDGLPWVVEGVVLYRGKRPVLWNGSEEIALYLPYGVTLEPGEVMRVLGIVRFYSTLSLLVDSPDDVEVLGSAMERPLSNASIGEIAVGNCTVTSVSRSLKLDCSSKRLYGFKARFGDRISVKVLVRKASLLCIECGVVLPREELPNSICSPEGGPLRVSGRLEWVKRYSNGFGLANLTNGSCWVLLKLRKSLGVSLDANDTVTAYGFGVTYRGMPAIEIPSGEDICSGKC